jgi:Ca2+-binding RTX toxin-like protein
VSGVPRAARAATLPMLPLALFVGVAVAASGSVPASYAGRSTHSVTANTLKPSSCASIVLSGVKSGSGTFSDTTASDLVLGGAAADTIRGLDGNDCILGGGGNDSLRGDAGTDVCIGGPGTDTFSYCETQIQ